MMAQSRSTAFASMVVLLATLVGGCASAGSSPPPGATTAPLGSAAETSGTSGAATGPLACDVVTSDMIQAALGKTVAAGTQEVLDLGGSTCAFKDAGITVRVFPDRDAAFLQSMKGSFSGAAELPGVGDGAWYSSPEATFMVLKGTTVVEVQAPNQNDQAKLVALAAAIAAKL
jgi:hypothetical protein